MFDVMVICAQDLASEISGAFMEQLFEGMIRRNFSEQAAADHTPEFRLWVQGGENFERFMLALKEGRDAGMKFSADWAYDHAGVQPPEDGDELLGDGLPTPQALPFGAQLPGAPGAPRPGQVLPFPSPSPKAQAGDTAPPTKDTGRAKALAERVILAYEGRLPQNPANELLATLESKAAEEAYHAGEQLLGPYADLLKRAVDEKWPMPQLLSRVLHRFYGRPGATAADLRDLLAATIADATLNGIEEARTARS